MVKKWDKVWIHAQICTLKGDQAYGLIKDGTIAIDQDRVVWLGQTNDFPSDVQAIETCDAKGCLITPGLIDCHTHLVYAGDRADEFALRLEGASYESIAQQGGGIRSTVKATRASSEDDLFEQSIIRARAMVAQGVRGLEIKSGYGLELETELKMLRVAKRIGETLSIPIATTFLGAHALPEAFKDNADGYIDAVCHDMLPEVARLGLADHVDAFCETIGFTASQVERVFQAAKQHNLRIKLHAEQLSNMGGTQMASKYQALSCDHLEYTCEEDVRAMAKANTVAVLLPGAFYFLQETKKPPIDLCRQYKVPMAIATDCNPGSSPTTSLRLMMNMACTLFGFTVEEALHAVTTHAARALAWPKTRAEISLGGPDNIVLWPNITSPAQLVSEF